MSVLCCIHQAYMSKVVPALRETFDMPLVCLVMWEQVEQELTLTEQEKTALGTFYSVPQFYHDNIEQIRAMSMDELDALQNELEAELKVTENVRITYYDRFFHKISDFRDCRNLQVVYLLLARNIFREHDISHVLLGRELYFWNILADAALANGKPALNISNGRHIGHRLIGRDSQGRQLGLAEAFETLVSKGEEAFPPEDIAAADQCFDTFISRPVRPSYSVKNTRSLKKSISNVFSGGLKFIINNIRQYQENIFDRESGMMDSSLEAMANWPRKAVRMARMTYGDLLQKKPDYSRKFVYLPLHRSPEVTDMYFGDQYAHHESFVFNVAKKLPSEYCLYVKDHTSMLGTRPCAFYEKLKSLYNVEVIHPYVSTFDLIQHCTATLAVTGTPGWEAYLLGKPTIVLGRVFYNCLPGLLYADLADDDFTTLLQSYMAEFSPDQERARTAMRAHYLSSYGTSFYQRDMQALGDNAKEFVAICHSIFRQWGDWIVANEPKGAARK